MRVGVCYDNVEDSAVTETKEGLAGEKGNKMRALYVLLTSKTFFTENLFLLVLW